MSDGLGFIIILALAAYVLFVATKSVAAEVHTVRWRRSLAAHERYATCPGCGHRIDLTCLGAVSEHWRHGSHYDLKVR